MESCHSLVMVKTNQKSHFPMQRNGSFMQKKFPSISIILILLTIPTINKHLILKANTNSNQ